MAKKPTTTKADVKTAGEEENAGGIRPRITSPEANAEGGDDSIDENEPQDNADGEDTSENEDAKESVEAKGDGVTGATNDGATYKSNDGATYASDNADLVNAGVEGEGGTPEVGSVNTQEGPTPIGVHGDTTGTDSPSGRAGGGTNLGPDNGLASATAMAGGSIPNNLIAEVVEVLSEFVTSEKTATPMSNIHDDLGVARADVTQLSDRLGKHFGIVIYASEAQNFLLVRDIINLVTRKLTKLARG